MSRIQTPFFPICPLVYPLAGYGNDALAPAVDIQEQTRLMWKVKTWQLAIDLTIESLVSEPPLVTSFAPWKGNGTIQFNCRGETTAIYSDSGALAFSSDTGTASTETDLICKPPGTVLRIVRIDSGSNTQLILNIAQPARNGAAFYPRAYLDFGSLAYGASPGFTNYRSSGVSAAPNPGVTATMFGHVFPMYGVAGYSGYPQATGSFTLTEVDNWPFA